MRWKKWLHTVTDLHMGFPNLKYDLDGLCGEVQCYLWPISYISKHI